MKYLVLDLETTGLHPHAHKILEIGAIAVTDGLDTVSTFERTVCFSEYDRNQAALVKEVREMHSASGLWDACAKAPTHHRIEYLDLVLLDWLTATGYKKGQVILAGHSIHFDRGFVAQHMPRTYGHLSHRMMDFGALNRFMFDCGLPVNLTPPMPHRAMADCVIELEEARGMRALLTSLRAPL